jgi:polyisoprenyl-phosphate glycosyltransferase
LITVVIPYFNESHSIKKVLERTHATFRRLGIKTYEVLVVNNGSDPRDSLSLQNEIKADITGHSRILELSRNFGYQGALWAGLDHASEGAVIFMDGDGEDPPEMIEALIEKWHEGYDVVYGIRLYGIRRTRQASWIMKLCYGAFYRILAKLSQTPIQLDAGEFSLISGEALTALRSFRDRTRMMRILRAWVGFRQTGIEYDREARIGGKSKFTFGAAVRFAWDGFVAATDIPVRMSIYCSLACFGLGIAGSIYYLCWYFFANTKIPGFASLNITILLLFSMLFMCLSVLSRYIITLLNEARGRPPYIVRKADKEVRSVRLLG